MDGARTGEEADRALATSDYDLVVLDVGLPHRRLRGAAAAARSAQRVPVLVLTARDALEDRVTGLDLGADDYLTKPFHLSELEARVRALIRRAHASASSELTHGRLRLDMAARRLYRDDQPIELSARELAVIELLLLRNRVVTKQQIVDHSTAGRTSSSSNAIEVFVYRLRKKLEPSRRRHPHRARHGLPDREAECRSEASRDPLLRTQLLAWLLVPLVRAADRRHLVSYWVALNFSQRAYDRSLVEIARDVSLHLRGANGAARRWTCRRRRAGVLLADPVDRIYFEVAAADGRRRRRRAAIALPPVSRERGAAEAFYDGVLRRRAGAHRRARVGGRRASGRAAGAWCGSPRPRTSATSWRARSCSSVVLPQVLLILIAGVVVWSAWCAASRRCSACSARSPRARTATCSPVVGGQRARARSGRCCSRSTNCWRGSTRR